VATDLPKLCLSADTFFGKGGQGINLAQMVEGLRDSFDVNVFSRGTIPGIRSRSMSRSLLSRIVGGTPFLRRLRDLQTYLEDVTFDRRVASRFAECAIFQGVTGQCLSSFGAAKRSGSATVLDSITVHIDEFAAVGRRACSRFGIRFPINDRMQQRMRQEYRLADRIRVMSQYAQNTFLERGFSSNKVIVAEPFYDMNEFSVVPSARSPFRVCFLGALEPWKGVQHLVEAFSTLEVDDAELVLYGGSGSHAVTHYLNQTVDQNRKISHKIVDTRESGFGAVFRGASVLVHPSLSDGWAQVVPEAMACGIPVIVTETTGAASLIRDGANGYLVQSGDPTAIAERLTFLAKHRDKIESMGAAARETVAEMTIDRFQQRYVPQLTGLLETGSR